MQLYVIEDFLSPQDFNNLQRLLIDRQFPWYLSQVVPNAPVLNNVQLVHFFYSDGLPQSPMFSKLEPVSNKIKEKTVSDRHLNVYYYHNAEEVEDKWIVYPWEKEDSETIQDYLK